MARLANIKVERKISELVLTGNAATNLVAEKLIEQVDIATKLENLHIEYFLIKDRLSHREELRLKEYFEPAKLKQIPEDLYSSNRFLELQASLEPFFKESFKLSEDEDSFNIRGTNIEIVRVSQDSYSLKMRNQSDKIMDKVILSYLDKAENLFSEQYLNKKLNKKLVLVIMKLL